MGGGASVGGGGGSVVRLSDCWWECGLRRVSVQILNLSGSTCAFLSSISALCASLVASSPSSPGKQMCKTSILSSSGFIIIAASRSA